jgi:hypothetical protein
MGSPGSVYEGQASGWGMRSHIFITILDDAVMEHELPRLCHAAVRQCV